MELKTVKEFAHKNNLGEGLKFESGLFQLDLDKEFNTIASSLNQLNTKLTLVNEQLGTVYKVEGSTKVDDINSMTVGNAMIGYVYNLLDSGVITNGLTGEIPVEAGDNVVYTENGWDKLSAALKIALEAGNNIAIEGNKINALGYWHDKTKDAIKTNLNYNIATGLYSLAQNEGTQATGKSSHAEGGLTVAEGDYSHSEGSNTFALGAYSHAEGYHTNTFNDSSHAEGNGTMAHGSNSHAEGSGTIAYGNASHAEGSGEETEITGLTWEAGSDSLLMTDTSIRIYPESILCFYADLTDYRKVVAVSDLQLTLDSPLPYSNQDVWYTGIVSGVAYGNYSHNEGLTTKSLGLASHAEGMYTISTNENEHAEGIYNKSNSGATNDLKTQHSVGMGSGEEDRKNSFEIMKNGDAYLTGVGDYDGTNPYEAKSLLKVINSKVEKEEGKLLSSNDYTDSDKEKVSLIESLQTTILELQEKINSKEYSIDFESDSTTAQEINLMNSMSLKKLVGYNITGVNLQIGTGSAVNLVLTDNVWEGDPIVINQGERVYWDIVKYDESAPAVLGIYETKIL